MTSPGSGIPQHAQKAILGRFLGFLALAPNLSTIESKSHRDIADRLIRRLCWLTNEMLDDPDSVLTRPSFSGVCWTGLKMKYAMPATQPGLLCSLCSGN